MSTAVGNRFGLLFEDEEPSVISQATTTRQVSKAAASVPKVTGTLMDQAKHNPKPKKEKDEKNKEVKAKDKKPSSVPVVQEDKKEKRNTKKAPSKPTEEKELEVSDGAFEKPKGMKRNNKRDHKPLHPDRLKSGRTFHDNEKKMTNGKANWGKSTDQGTFDNGSHMNQQVLSPVEEEERAPTPAAASSQPILKTLAQYLSEKVSKLMPTTETRKVNEGVDSSLLKDGKVLEKKEDVFFVGKSKQVKKK